MTVPPANETAPWPVVQTDAGPVTLATVGELETRATQWRAWSAQSTTVAQSLHRQAEDRWVATGAILVDRSAAWTVPGELQATLAQAKLLTDQVAADDQRAAELKGQESTAGLIGKIGVRHHEHEVEKDRSKLAAQLHGLLAQIARSAPANGLTEAEEQYKAATDLEAQARALEAQLEAALGWAAACEQEVARRTEAIKAMGFDSLYEAATLQSSGAEPVGSPLVLKAGEKAFLSVPATLARMMTRTHYQGGSTGFSFPIGHTGIRYRVGAFRGEPVHQQSLTKLDNGTFVLTNQRVAYLGQTKSTSVALSKVMHAEVFTNCLSIAREGKENPDFYLLSNPQHAVFLLNWALSKQSEVR